MTDRDLHLSAKHCNEAFPFHLILDEHLCIMQISAKFLKFIPKLKPGQNFQDVLINEDDMALLTYDEINSRVDKGYVFRTKDTKGPRFRIGFYETSDANLLLVATPIITNSRDILGASLSFDDFAPHDTILEHISVVQTKDSMFKDMRAFADRLEMLIEERTAELNKSQKVLSEAQRIGGLGSWDLNVHTGEAHWSDQRFRMFGYEPDEIEASFENLKKASTQMILIGSYLRSCTLAAPKKNLILNFASFVPTGNNASYVRSVKPSVTMTLCPVR